MTEWGEVWSPWTAARFKSSEARDRFLAAVYHLEVDGIEAEPMDQSSEGAWVRWRAEFLLAINDLAHAHGGEVILSAIGPEP